MRPDMQPDGDALKYLDRHGRKPYPFYLLVPMHNRADSVCAVSALLYRNLLPQFINRIRGDDSSDY